MAFTPARLRQARVASTARMRGVLPPVGSDVSSGESRWTWPGESPPDDSEDRAPMSSPPPPDGPPASAPRSPRRTRCGSPPSRCTHYDAASDTYHCSYGPPVPAVTVHDPERGRAGAGRAAHPAGGGLLDPGRSRPGTPPTPSPTATSRSSCRPPGRSAPTQDPLEALSRPERSASVGGCSVHSPDRSRPAGTRSHEWRLRASASRISASPRSPTTCPSATRSSSSSRPTTPAFR